MVPFVSHTVIYHFSGVLPTSQSRRHLHLGDRKWESIQDDFFSLHQSGQHHHFTAWSRLPFFPAPPLTVRDCYSSHSIADCYSTGSRHTAAPHPTEHLQQTAQHCFNTPPTVWGNKNNTLIVWNMQRDKFKKTYTHKNNKQTHTEKRQKLKTRTHISQVITISIKN